MYEHIAKNIFGSEKRALLAAIEHELEGIEIGILRYCAKYDSNFSEFSASLSEGKIANPNSYEVEMDFNEWEAMETRKKKLVAAMRGLI